MSCDVYTPSTGLLQQCMTVVLLPPPVLNVNIQLDKLQEILSETKQPTRFSL